MIYNHDDPATWPQFDPLIIAHDVGGRRDRSTAVVGGNAPAAPRRLGILDLQELPLGLYGSPRASALAAIDRKYNNNAVIVADLSHDPSYAEVLHETFGPRVIGLHITRSGDGQQAERRPVGHGAMLVYTVGRNYLLELLQSEFTSDQMRMVDTPEARRAYAQLAGLETEMRESGIVYKCPAGQHDDLGISCAMLAFAARHPHLRSWVASARPRGIARRDPGYGWGAFV
jgi:hypothetical protein